MEEKVLLIQKIQNLVLLLYLVMIIFYFTGRGIISSSFKMRLRRPLPATWVSLALASAALLPLMPAAEANCIWYGECGLNPDNGKSLNCA